jgi:hypothetical protein
MSNNNGQLETKDMEVKVAVDRTFLGWLCAATGLTPKVALCHLYDLTTLPLENLLKRNGTWVSRKVDFPDSTIKLKVNCGRHHDEALYRKYVKAWEAHCEASGMKPYANDMRYKTWLRTNPFPNRSYHDPAYNYVKCKFTIIGQEKEIVFTQHEMENLVTETLLLGVDEDGED